MIKGIKKIFKPFGDPEETETSFMWGIVSNTCAIPVSPEHGRFYKELNLKRDDLGKFYLETVCIFKDMEVAKRNFETGVYVRKAFEKIAALGYKWSIEYVDLPKEMESLYLEEIENKVCPDFLNGCKCSICEHNRRLDIPNKYEHDGPPRNLEQIGKTGYEK